MSLRIRCSKFTLAISAAALIVSTHAIANNPITPLSKAKHSATDIRMITPFTGQGLNPKLRVIKTASGVCWSSSLIDGSRPNTWRCHSSERVYDPCFNNPIRDKNSVVCLEHPWDKEVVVLNLKAPLPTTKTQQFDQNQSEPWAIELANGRLCTLITGPKFTVAGMQSHYHCSNGSLVIGDIDRKHKKWVVFYLGNDDLYMHQTEVLSAWY